MKDGIQRRKIALFPVCLLFSALLLLLTGFYSPASGAVDLPEETITADAIDERDLDVELSAGAVSVIRATDYEGETNDLPELLDRVPGLHVVRAGGRGSYTVASVRGSTSSQVAVYVDGILMNLGSEAAVDLSTIPVDNVERIEVYRGYIPARFGASGMGGVINIVTKKPQGESTTISAGIGSYGLWKAAATHTGRMGSGHYLVGINHESADGDFKYDNDNGTPYNYDDDYRGKRQHNDYSNSEVLFKWQDEHWQARVSWLKHERDLALSAPGQDKPDSPAGADLDTEKLELSLGRRHTSGIVDWGWRLEYLHQDKEFNDPNDTTGGLNEIHNRYKTDRFNVALDASAALGERHFLELYAGYYDEQLKSGGDIVNALGSNEKMTNRTFETTLQDSISLTTDGSLLLIPSLRWMSDDEDDKLTWQLAVNKFWNSGLYFKTSYGTYTRSPNLYERYGDGATIRPSVDLKWETGTQWDAGIGWQGRTGRGKLTAGLTYFHRDTDDLIEYIMTHPRYGKYVNIGEAKVDGIELELNYDWDSGWSLFASGTWMDAKDNTPGSYRADNPLPNRPEWEGLLRLTRKWNERFSSFAEVQYTGENYYDQAGAIKFDNLTVVNLGAAYNFKNGMKLSAGVRDLFDESPAVALVTDDMARTAWYPMQGRTIYTNIFWTF